MKILTPIKTVDGLFKSGVWEMQAPIPASHN